MSTSDPEDEKNCWYVMGFVPLGDPAATVASGDSILSVLTLLLRVHVRRRGSFPLVILRLRWRVATAFSPLHDFAPAMTISRSPREELATGPRVQAAEKNSILENVTHLATAFVHIINVLGCRPAA
jgi:hypothetical protein